MNHQAGLSLRFARLLLAFALAGAGLFSLPNLQAEPRDRVAIAPTKTSIYIGRVSMTMPVFQRENGVYRSTYAAKVVPYFFYNEQGQLSIDVGDDALAQLARGEVIEFSGRAMNDQGEERRIEGRAVPADARHGKIKVRVFVSKRIQLIFNTTYEFVGE